MNAIKMHTTEVIFTSAIFEVNTNLFMDGMNIIVSFFVV